MRGAWRLEGWDAFGGHAYAIPGRYRTRRQAQRAAERELAKLESMQPTALSGGQSGLQDQIFVVAPDGQRIQVCPRAPDPAR